MAVEEPRAGAARRREAVAAAWPDDGARAFAADFARAYLTLRRRSDPDGVRAGAGRVRGAGAGELDRAGVRRGRAARRSVQDVRSRGSARVDDRHALVTVAVTLAGERAARGI